MTIASDRRPGITRSRHHSETRFFLPAGADEIRARVERIAHHRPELSLISADASMVTVFRRPNLFSWGETVTVRWKPAASGVDVHISTEARIRTLLGDYGQRRRDLETFRRGLSDTEVRD